MTVPAVSVVMSVYNGERYLRSAIESILAQTWRNFEFIIVDDGSQDSTGGLLTEYAAADSRLVVLANPTNVGYTRALNRGLDIARGRYVARQDADDISLPERLAAQVALLDARPEVGLAGTLAQIIDARGHLRDMDYFPRALDNAAIQRQLLAANCLCHGSVLMRRHILEKVGRYDIACEPSEDHDLWLRLGEVSEIVNVEPRLYQYRVHAESVSSRRRREQLTSRAKLVERALHRRHGAALQPAQRSIVARQYLEAAIATFDAGLVVEARGQLRHALEEQPRLLDDEATLSALVVDYAVHRETEAGDWFLRQVFDDFLPRRGSLARLRARLLSDFHMREVFAGAQSRVHGRVDAHLWPALRHGPAWLLNRGVLAILSKSLLRRGLRR